MDETTVPAETTLATREEFADLCHGVDLSPMDRARQRECLKCGGGGQLVVGEETPVAEGEWERSERSGIGDDRCCGGEYRGFCSACRV